MVLYENAQVHNRENTWTEIALLASALKRPIIITNVATDTVRIFNTHKNEPSIITTIAHNQRLQLRRDIVLSHPIHLLYDPQHEAEHYNAVILPYDDKQHNSTPAAPPTPSPRAAATIHTDMRSWTNTMEPRTIRASQTLSPPNKKRTRHSLTSKIHQQKKQKKPDEHIPHWATTSTYLKGVRIEILLNDGTRETELAWYDGIVTAVHDAHTVQWKCDDGETIDQLNLTNAQWKILPMTEAKKFLINNRVKAMQPQRKRKRTRSPRESRKHWKKQLNDQHLQQIKLLYREAVQRSKRKDRSPGETPDAKKTKRDHDRKKEDRKREIDRGDGIHCAK
jgi:hypothetical protein